MLTLRVRSALFVALAILNQLFEVFIVLLALMMNVSLACATRSTVKTDLDLIKFIEALQTLVSMQIRLILKATICLLDACKLTL